MDAEQNFRDWLSVLAGRLARHVVSEQRRDDPDWDLCAAEHGMSGNAWAGLRQWEERERVAAELLTLSRSTQEALLALAERGRS